ncbi:OmpA family protein [Aliikangiella marina]|uniref:OmpA family protein n=1 Tax=Aliikangiella marina TaxID=1712262 RepID=A0A545TDX5_9GAMM|nr:OmpA family protein [Aliikangiella marina]TQV75366.1 OmpA family protein [Aliikangiella marina]
MRRRRYRERVFDDDQETGRWLISYADFITLLFAFFVVMYSISQVSESKYKQLADSLIVAFDTPQRSLDPLQIGEINRSLQPITGDDIEQPEVDSESEESGNMDSENFATLDEFKALENGLRESLGDLIEQDLAEINSDANWININLQSGLLFSSGSDELNQAADPLLSEVSEHLNKNRQMILVQGHTDNIPINTEKFPSNWELSSSRAVAVVRKLQNLNVLPERMSVEGHGEFKPIESNDTLEGRSKNRRVVVSISRKQALTEPTSTAQVVPSPSLPATETVTKDAEPEFDIVRLPGGGILIRGKELPEQESDGQDN